MILRAIIVDDELPAIRMLKLFLLANGAVEIVAEFTKSSEALKHIGSLQPDVVFLDIEMPGINGLELAEHILAQATETEIIFVTAFRNYAVEAFELNAVDYLLKPALQEKVDRAVSRLLLQKKLQPETRTSCAGNYINCFGQFTVRRFGGDVPLKWRTAKVEELFAFLLYHRGTILPKGKIIDSLWPECEPECADNNLYTSVYRLKKTLKENNLNVSIRLSGGGYMMELGAGIRCDVADFESFVARGEILTAQTVADFEKIIALYQGDYLEGKDYPWCVAERVRMQQDFSYLIKQIARYRIDIAEYQKAEQIILKLLEYLPYDEEAYEILLRAFIMQEDRVSLMKYYERLTSLLQNELGIEPRPSLKRLYENYMNQF